MLGTITLLPRNWLPLREIYATACWIRVGRLRRPPFAYPMPPIERKKKKKRRTPLAFVILYRYKDETWSKPSTINLYLYKERYWKFCRGGRETHKSGSIDMLTSTNCQILRFISNRVKCHANLYISRKFGKSLTFYCTFDFSIEKCWAFGELLRSRLIGHCATVASLLPPLLLYDILERHNKFFADFFDLPFLLYRSFD